MSAIRFQNVTKSFRRSSERLLLRHHAKELFRRTPHEPFHALKNVSFEIAPGESVAVVGRNGAGKSTLLSLVAGLAQPSSGRAEVNGTVAALLELGSGFHPDLTGRENVSLYASLLGLTRKRTQEQFPSIVEFAEIGDFMEEPLRTYSSGMIVRLAFAVAINVEPDILIIDEVIAVGDSAFQAKCFAKMREFHQAGKTLLCVSHGPAILRELCERAVWLDHGEVKMIGSIADVLDAYAGFQMPPTSSP